MWAGNRRTHHALRVGNKVRRDVAAVKLHALHHIQVVLCSPALLHGDHALPAHSAHGVADQLPNLQGRISASADSTMCCQGFTAQALERLHGLACDLHIRCSGFAKKGHPGTCQVFRCHHIYTAKHSQYSAQTLLTQRSRVCVFRLTNRYIPHTHSSLCRQARQRLADSPLHCLRQTRWPHWRGPRHGPPLKAAAAPLPSRPLSSQCHASTAAIHTPPVSPVLVGKSAMITNTIVTSPNLRSELKLHEGHHWTEAQTLNHPHLSRGLQRQAQQHRQRFLHVHVQKGHLSEDCSIG